MPLQALLPLYHSMPPFAQSWAASLLGYRLQRWRFGPETEQLVQEALARETWPVAQLRAWSMERVSELLHRAEHKVPYYRDLWSKRRQKGDNRSSEYLENWPILEKDAVRNHPRAFLADDCDVRRMRTTGTSGTTGTPLEFLESRESTRRWYALAEARWRRWYGVSFKDRWAIIGGKMVVPIWRKQPPFWVWNRGLNQLYISSYHLEPDAIPAILDAIERYGITYLSGYTASINELARGARRLGRRVPLKVVIPEAESVFDYQRVAIEDVFCCPVRETYGMTEHACAASECEHGRLHLWPEAGWAEVCHGDEKVIPGEPGELVLTGLINTDMPLIRYRVGDRGRIGPHRDCECGRSLRYVDSFEGRTADVLRTADGRVLSSNAVDIVFSSDLPLKEAQIVQKSLSQVLVRMVPDSGFLAEHNTRLTRSLQERLGPVNVSFEVLPRIPRGPNGKFKVVASEVKPSEIEHRRG